MPHDEIHRGCAVSVGLVVPPVAAPCSHAPHSYSFSLHAIRPRRRTWSRECVFGAAVKRRWLRYEISPRLCAPACADRIERRSTAREPQARMHARLRSGGAHFAQESRLLKYHITENAYFDFNVRGTYEQEWHSTTPIRRRRRRRSYRSTGRCRQDTGGRSRFYLH